MIFGPCYVWFFLQGACEKVEQWTAAYELTRKWKAVAISPGGLSEERLKRLEEYGFVQVLQNPATIIPAVVLFGSFEVHCNVTNFVFWAALTSLRIWSFELLLIFLILLLYFVPTSHFEARWLLWPLIWSRGQALHAWGPWSLTCVSKSTKTIGFLVPPCRSSMGFFTEKFAFFSM